MVKKVTDEQVEKMMAFFAGNADAHGTHGVPTSNGLKWEIKSTAKTLREPVTLEVWRQHLEGTRPLGVVPINDEAQCWWGSIDIDEYDSDLLTMVRSAEKYPLVPCRSKSGGLHLFLFVSEPVPAGDMQAVLRAVSASIGKAGSEIFPKQSEVLAHRGDVGNWIVMPYYGDTYGGKLQEQVGLKKTGSTMTLQEFITLVQSKRLDATEFAALANSTRQGKVAAITKGRGGKGKVGGTSGNGPFGDGPPCLQHMSASGFPEGGRNNALFMVGLYLKRSNPSEWKRMLEQDNQAYMRPPLTSDEVTAVRKQLEKKEYEYTCGVEPMKGHCDSGLCRTRKFGVGDTGEYPDISCMTRYETEPTIWFVTVAGRRIEVSTENLISYTRFQSVAADKLNRFFSPMKQADWLKILNEVSKTAEILDPPQGTSSTDIMHELLTEFLTNRSRGERMEDLLMGRPVLNEEHKRYYFRAQDLEAFIDKKKVKKEYTRAKLAWYIRSKDGGDSRLRIGKKQVSVWWIPMEHIEETPSVDPEKIQKEDV